jgi:hypothetical protein
MVSDYKKIAEEISKIMEDDRRAKVFIRSNSQMENDYQLLQIWFEDEEEDGGHLMGKIESGTILCLDNRSIYLKKILF